MSDGELAEVGRQLPDGDLATILRRVLGAPDEPAGRLAERAGRAAVEPRVSGRHLETPVQDAVLEVLGGHPNGLTFTALRKLCGTSKGSTYAACERHLKAGAVQRVGKGQGSTWKLAWLGGAGPAPDTDADVLELEAQWAVNEIELDQMLPVGFVPEPGPKKTGGKQRRWRKGWL